MRSRSWLALGVVALLTSPAFADYGSPPPRPETPPPTSQSVPGSVEASTARQEAERKFADAYDDVTHAAKDADKGKKDNAAKRYKRALERCRDAVALDSTYYEAWNLVGFTSRKLGDYPNSFAAYKVALRLKPDFALAHEYYGEGLLETGDLAGAREQLAELQKSGTVGQYSELQKAIDVYVAAHPQAAPAAPSTAAVRDSATAPTPAQAQADTTKTPGGQ